MKSELFIKHEAAIGTNRYPIKKEIREWLSVQCIDEADVIEMEWMDILFIAKFYEVWKKGVAVVEPAVRGVILKCDVGYVELFQQGDWFDVRVYPDYDRMSGALKVLTNIKLSFDEKKLGGCKYDAAICCKK